MTPRTEHALHWPLYVPLLLVPVSVPGASTRTSRLSSVCLSVRPSSSAKVEWLVLLVESRESLLVVIADGAVGIHLDCLDFLYY